MNRVWSHSQQSGGALLALLAIADFADDNGRAFPSIETLANKARISDRQTQRVLRKLVKDGELTVEKGKGPGRVHAYIVTLSKGDRLSPSAKAEGVTDCHPGEGDRLSPSGVTSETPEGDISGTSRVTFEALAYKADPSVDPSEDPSVVETTTGADAPSTPKLPIPAAAKDPDDYALWNLGLNMVRKSLPREEQARSFIGKQIKDFGKPRVVRAIIDMLANAPINPSDYLVATLQAMTSRETGGNQNTSGIGKQQPTKFETACSAVEMVMSLENLTLAEAIERLRDPEQQGGTLLLNAPDELVNSVIHYFVNDRGCKYEPRAEVA